MSKVSRIAFAACVCAVSSVPAAYAADLTPIYEPAPIPPKVFAGWYLRGDIGISNQKVDELYNVLYDGAETLSVDNQYKDFSSAGFMGIGVGYQMNRWLRFDVTGEYRASADFDGADVYETDAGFFPNDYRAKKSEWLALANAYVDVGTWHGLTPFVGAGIGAVNLKISDFSDIGIGTDDFPSFAYADDHDEWNFAWALYAGLAFDVTDNFTVELAYRYLNLGDGESGNLVAYDGTDEFDNPMEFNDITSHDIKLGVRYSFF